MACPAVKGSMINGSLAGIPAPFQAICTGQFTSFRNTLDRWGFLEELNVRWLELYSVPLAKQVAAQQVLKKYLNSAPYQYAWRGEVRNLTNTSTTAWLSAKTKKGIWVSTLVDQKRGVVIYAVLGITASIDNEDRAGLARQIGGAINNAGLGASGDEFEGFRAKTNLFAAVKATASTRPPPPASGAPASPPVTCRGGASPVACLSKASPATARSQAVCDQDADTNNQLAARNTSGYLRHISFPYASGEGLFSIASLAELFEQSAGLLGARYIYSHDFPLFSEWYYRFPDQSEMVIVNRFYDRVWCVHRIRSF